MNIAGRTAYERYRTRAGLSIVELAARSGISVRDIAAAERGEYMFTPRELLSLSEVFGVSLSLLLNTELHRAPMRNLVPTAMVVVMLCFVVTGGLAWPQIQSLIASTPIHARASESQRTGGHAITAYSNGASTKLRSQLIGLAVADPMSAMPAMGGQDVENPSVTANTAPLAAIASKRGALGAPYGCPVQPTVGQVVMTQSYGVGTHAPAAVWGAVDLAVDGDMNGYADPSATVGAPVVALHAGIARVVPNNWLAGNYVRLTDELNGWATAYAHLKKLNITDGQRIEPGMVIGWVGNTGYSSGPHLHYEVYQNEININPLTVLECW
jgi:murein DD-endopeptidase MepM/ murein hydrolase activator NlpD